jgi:hypothetical protein
LLKVCSRAVTTVCILQQSSHCTSNNTCRVSSFSLLHSSQTTEHCTWFCLSWNFVGRRSDKSSKVYT